MRTGSDFGASPTEKITPIRVAVMSKKAGDDKNIMAGDEFKQYAFGKNTILLRVDTKSKNVDKIASYLS